jgi:hypothetical protein
MPERREIKKRARNETPKKTKKRLLGGACVQGIYRGVKGEGDGEGVSCEV